MSNSINPYGNGDSAKVICAKISEYLKIKKNSNILGLGYMDCRWLEFADAGYHVNGTDVNPNIISMLQNGCFPY